CAHAAASQVIPRLPGGRPGGIQPVKPDSIRDSTRVKWPTPDSVAQLLLAKKGYSITRYQGDTAFFSANDTNRVIDLLASKNRRAIVDRDSQVIVSDSGVYYTEKTRHVVTGGHYVMIPPPSSGQANVNGVGRMDYDAPNKTLRVNGARLPVNNGEMWYMQMKTAELVGDSTNGKSPTIYARGGSLTSCDDSIPDYHFEFGEAKRTSGNTLVARPAVLYIKDIPVMWFPFMFTDTKSGRHSGILVPQFGIGDIVRNSPTYRRNVDHAGYYWALNDYMDFGTWLDWRSSAGSRLGDPGWLKYNADWSYRWLDRFLGGRVGLGYTTQGDGTTNTAISWTHTQDFSHDAHINTNFNYVTNTTVQRQNTFNPYSALATISSQATYQNKLGPASLSIGATQRQYPGRPQIDRTFPTLSLTSTAIGLGSWLSWTPSFSFSRSDVLHMDQPGLGAYVFDVDPTTGVRDSSLAKNRSSSQSSISFDTPLQIFGKDFKNSFRVNQQRNDFPQQFQIYDLNTGQVKESRVYAATYRTDVDWTPDFTIPSLGQNRFNFSPSVSLQNVDPGPYFVQTERTGGKFVHQSKRFTFGASASPTLYALLPGFGPFSRIRHSVSPTIGYTYAPSAHVSDEYLLALGRTRFGYLGSLRQNQLNFGLNQNFEAKIRPKGNDTTGTDKGQTIRLLSLNMTPLAYDFERAAHARDQNVKSKWAGLTTETWGYNLNSELLPGFDFSTSYSLFEGSTLSDSARFKPFLTSISASFSVGRDQNPFTVFSKLFGKPEPAPKATAPAGPTPEQARQQAEDAQSRALAAAPVAGSARGTDRFLLPTTQGWRASFQFSRSSPRPPTGDNVIEFDPLVRCQQITGNNPFLLDACLAQQRAQPTTDTPVGSLTAGGPAYHIPPTTSLNSNVSFNLTPKWTAAWQTTYDLERHEFASHIVSLQRDIHDWRAMFGFTQSPNGNFSFNFSIALKAEQDLKFDYNRSTVRSGLAPF
ncbi:MAG: putative LPS assembly protein LptD, partial [bacterium]